MWVCFCVTVSSGTIESVIEGGARTVAAVGEACGAGTVCGRCQPTIVHLIERHQLDESVGGGKGKEGNWWPETK